ncbi:cellulose biosynthesis protein BcsC [Burkholderia glumae]|uniref:cellulose biosynthesis protein BcsC n=1 Tax=Burkholderia glumae TaxID=337 RepID=UPI0015934A1F|nr:cellulose biosynthesis protein BcsC [Burkholderia glumae]MCM2494730.1 cellulose synthase subunit BcsC-related outer membrane protein [Burkholderia glumae]MCM2551422.1 cellulose synthase subunit BcsC-related outer membrane protein [Burkholderia glumae]NVE25628.1 BCSC C-terminal domain-containing protein [Burkholderia glumae]
MPMKRAQAVRRAPARAPALLLALALAAGAFTHAPRAAAAAADPALQALIDQGRYWQAHGRGDLAEQAWKKVLGIDAKQPDALLGMGMVMADRKEGAQAASYLERLRRSAPNTPGIDELGRRLGQSTPRDQTIDDARRLAQSGQSASAVQQYQKAMSGAPATPELRLEYYQALSATPRGWDEARKGLEALARENPDDPRYALAYAQHLTYRDVTRREGIARLQQLADDAKVGQQARESWRQALLWLAARPSDQPMFDAYLKLAPNDSAVKARYDSMVMQGQAGSQRSAREQAQDARGRAVGEGFAALDRNDLATARARFTAVLSSAPNDSDALGGLGIVELKQEHFREARDALERASRTGDPARWREALKSATYWTYTSEALGAQSNGDPAKAKSLFERAIALDPSEVSGELMLGELLLGNHDPRGAEQAYRMALRRQADNPDAIRGLVGALAAQGRGDEALQFANQLTAEQQASAGGLDRLRGTALAAQARAAEAQGDLGRARSLFEEALVGDADDPWLRLDLARIYVRQGAVASARSMMDGLLAEHPDMVDAQYAGALLAEQTHDYGNGLRLLERVPADKRSAAMGELQHRLWLGQQAELAMQMVRRGQTGQAMALLRAAEPVAQGNPALLGQLAGAYLAAGDTGRAMALVQGAMASAPADAGLRLQYANLLFASHQDALLGEQMQRLHAMPLNAEQRAELDRIDLAIVVRRADLVRTSGDLASAYAVIAPWLAALPDNPDLQAALGRLYTSAGDPANALTCYRIALARRADDHGLQLATLYAATGAKQWRYAEQIAKLALAGAPDDPGTLAAVGRMYRAEGNLTLAARYLKQSLVASSTPPAGRVAAGPVANVPRGWEALSRPLGANPLPGTNPFEGRAAVDTTGAPDSAGAAAAAAANTYAPAVPSSFTPSSPVPIVPAYLPAAHPAPYVAPYRAPAGVTPGSRAPAASAGAAGAADSAGYGPAAAAGGESGGPAARPLQPYSQYAPGAPAQPDAPGYAQQEYAPPQGGYPQQAYRQPGYAPQGYAQQQGYPQQGYAAQANPPPAYAPQSYAPAPWPMSPAAQAAQRDAYRQPAAKRGAARRPARANRAAQQPAYAQGGYPQPGDAQPAYAPYPQQGYAPPYPQGGYPQGGYPQQPAYAPNGYARQPYPAYNPQPPYPQPAQGPDYIPPPPAGYAQPYAPAAVAAEAAPQPSANPQTVGVADELAAINREQSSSVSAGLVLRNRAGEDGLSTLNDIEAPIEGRIKAGNGHLVITATPVTLDSGTGVDDIPTHARFGSGLSQTASPAGGYGSQTAMGVGVSLGYETKSIKADLGSTPVGFRYQTAVGGLEYHGGFNDKVSYSLAVTRRAVTDSLLSYAGARDAATGQQWGGVTKSGGRAALGWDDGTNGLYVNGELMYYAGHHVANNIGGKAGGGFYTRLYKDAQQTLTAGVNATWMSFDKNQSYFTYGQGGYFSPQQYVILNIPLEYAGRSGPFTYDLKGSAGLQHYRQNAARYFPLDPGLDSSAAANRNAATAANPTLVLDSNAVYPGQSKTSFSYSLYASGEYQLAPQVAVGAMASYGNAYQYREWLAAVYLRYSFTPQSGAPLFPPRKFSSPYLADSD